jgi:hypothetical protein
MEENQAVFEYNSQKSKLLIPEYGRHVQNLIDHAKTIADLNERQVFVEKIVDLIHQMNPYYRNVEEYRSKLWAHVLKIANYELNVVPPEGVATTESEEVEKFERLPYPSQSARLKHYGYHVQELIKKALELEEGPKRNGLIRVISSYMKLAYRTWSQDQYISDEVIKSDLKMLSKGEIVIDEDTVIDNMSGGGGGGSRRKYKKGGSSKSRHSKGRRRK